MYYNRREFLSRSAALGAALALPQFTRAEVALGSANLTSLTDGHLVLPKSFILGEQPSAELDPLLEKFGLTGDELTPPCNITLYQDGTNNVLFDVGAGGEFQPSAGRLIESLDAIGLAPDDITHVVFTHAHPDHLWGLLDDFGDPVFAEAQYLFGRDEWDYWIDPETVNSIESQRQAFAVGAKRRLEMIEDQVQFFDDDQEILPGVQSILTPGHTPGHMSFELRQGGDAVLVTGDAIANSNLAFARPDWQYGSDQDQALGATTRVKLFDRILADNLMISGFHMDAGGIGHVDQSDDGYVFVAQQS